MKKKYSCLFISVFILMTSTIFAIEPPLPAPINQSEDIFRRNLPSMWNERINTQSPNYTGEAIHNGYMQDLKSILKHRDEFTEKMLITLIGNEKPNMISKYYNPISLKTSNAIKITLAMKNKDKNIIDIAHITITNKKSHTMVSTLAQAALDAIRKGASILFISNYGCDKKMIGSGWGVGIGNSLSLLSETQSKATGGVAVGGLGYSSGKSGYIYLPWIQAWAYGDLRNKVEENVILIDKESQNNNNQVH